MSPRAMLLMGLVILVLLAVFVVGPHLHPHCHVIGLGGCAR